MDYSCCTHGRIMSHMVHIDESCRTHSFIKSHTCMNLVAMHDACVPVFIDAEIDWYFAGGVCVCQLCVCALGVVRVQITLHADIQVNACTYVLRECHYLFALYS